MPEADHSTLYLIWQTIYEVYLATVSSPDAGAPPLLCTEWTKYDAFASWAHEHGYQNGLYLERINIPQSYSPENCVWTDVRHRSKNAPRLIAAFGENKSFAAWANDIRCTVDVMTIRYRLHRGWNPEQAISTPPAKRTRHDSGATPSTIALGAQFDRLTVIGPCVIGRNRKGKPSYLYRCKCTCGNEVTVEASSLLYANIHSCGCFKREKFIELHTIHGEAHTRLYVQWQSIR